METKTYNHTFIQEGHTPRANLENLYSEANFLEIVPNPTKRYLRKLEISHVHCTDCQKTGTVSRNGRSKMGVQKYICKCGNQFSMQFSAIFPESKRRDIFNDEFRKHFDYWSGARLETIQMAESQVMQIIVNKMVKNTYDGVIDCQQSYDILLRYLIHNAYHMVMAK